MKEKKITIKVSIYEVGDIFSIFREGGGSILKGDILQFTHSYHQVKAVCIDCKFSGFDDYWKCIYKVTEVTENANAKESVPYQLESNRNPN